MTQFNPVDRKFRALIFKSGAVEVREATHDLIEGCVYFSSGTKAFKVATDLLAKSLITAKRSGFMVLSTGFMETEGSYYLGAVILSEQVRNTPEHEEERTKSKLIHGVSYARS